MNRSQFTFYDSFFRDISRIKKASDRAAAYDAICAYALYGTEPDIDQLPDAAAIAFEVAKPNLDASRAKAKNGRSGGIAKQTEANSKQTEANAKQNKESLKQVKEQEQEKEKEKDKEQMLPPISPSRGTRFIPPTPDEVRAYCLERGGRVSAEKWYDYYTANGWKVGKNPMKDWKAAVRNWERTEKHGGSRDTGFETSNPFLEMMEERRGMG